MNNDQDFLRKLNITPCEFPNPAVAQRVEDVTPADAWITRDEDGEPAVLMSEATYQALIALAQARHAESVRLSLLLVGARHEREVARRCTWLCLGTAIAALAILGWKA